MARESSAPALERAAAEPEEASPVAPKDAVEQLLEHVPEAIDLAAPPALRTARVVSIHGGSATIAYRGRSREVEAEIDGGVDEEIVARAMENGDRVLVEVDPALGPTIVGVIQTRVPAAVEIKAQRVAIEAEDEVLLRAGRAALRLRADGDVELVGSRISTLSRGLFRIVGRVLRLN